MKANENIGIHAADLLKIIFLKISYICMSLSNLKLKDLGKSAFKGVHRTSGALGQFLKLVEEHKIEKGSILIVENLDRLSREQVLDALTQFTNIIKSGISVVTLQDNMMYSEESVNANFGQLLMSIVYMSRAHEESKVKSDRLKAAWSEKRKKASNGKYKLSGRCPAWLKLSKDKTKFEIIPEIAEAVKLIYQLKSQGIGKSKIAKLLNQDKKFMRPVTKRNKTGGWRESYIQKILTSRAVIGEYQPHSIVSGEREPIGDPIQDYYPPIISRDLFLQVENSIAQNRELNGYSGGKTGKAHNLFAHVVFCGKCGSPMHFLDKGKGKNEKYLRCSHSLRKLDCDANSIKYDEFEKLFFDNFEELHVSDLLPDKNEIQARLTKIEKSIVSKGQELRELGQGIENLTDTIVKTNSEIVRETLEKRLSKVLHQKEKISDEIKAFNTEKQSLLIEEEQLNQKLEIAKEVYSLLQTAKDEQEQISIRLRLRQEIKNIVERIEIYPLEEKYIAAKEIDSDIVQFMDSKYIDHVRIKFRGNNKRILYCKSYGEKIN